MVSRYLPRMANFVLLMFVIPSATANGIQDLLGQEKLTIRNTTIASLGFLDEVYRGNDYQPFWSQPGQVTELLELIESAREHGLNPADYNLLALRDIRQQSQNWSGRPAPADSDILLTETLALYASHRRYGKVRARALDPNINYKRQPLFADSPPNEVMKHILGAGSLHDFIDVAAPSGPLYRNLQGVLAKYRAIEAFGGWPLVQAGDTLRLGDESPRVLGLRSRLAASGDLDPADGIQSPVFDEMLKQAVIRFQQRHALGADGIVGAQTYATLNVPLQHRIEQLRLSLERLRWVNQEAAETLVAVNIAGYRAFFIRNGEVVWETRTSVGKTYRQTPVFRGDIAYMEFNPTWTIPPGILRADTLPAIKKDPEYLAKKEIRVLDHQGREIDASTINWHQYSRSVPYILRQDPGPQNSLGTVKFIFPNKHFVFLHDTPGHEQFAHSERAFSSGCIRVEDPLTLAELLLNDERTYPRSALQNIVNSRKTERLHLNPSVPVVIVYLTASVDDEGSALFYRDIYDRDGAVLDALNAAPMIQFAED